MYARKLYLSLLCLLLALGVTTSARSDIKKSPNDNKTYKSVILPNGLESLLISDPDTTKGAAALDVAVGSAADPENYEGMAHFLEHMLFLGTKDFPEAGAYQSFISQHGGNHNAYTAFEHTNYFFDVDQKYLEPALHRFSQQFVAPLFNEAYVEREKHAVHSEYSAKLKDDSRRYFSAFKASINPEHPFSRFSVGNLETLNGSDDKSLREALVQFYQKHYSANLMKLVVISNQPIHQLESMVRKYFTDIPNHQYSRTSFTQSLFKSGELPQKLFVKPLKESRSLSLTFPIPSTKSVYTFKPTYFLSNLIGDEGPGSLTSLLKNLGWIESLSSGEGFDVGSGSTFNISIQLTETGFEHWQDILSACFETIALVKEKGIHARYFDEQKRLQELAFTFKEKSEGIHYAMSLANLLQDFPVDDVLYANYRMDSFNQDIIESYLNYLNPENVQVALMAPEVETSSTTQWYNTEYSIEVGPLPFKISANDPLLKSISLPEENVFIPKNLSFIQTDNKQPSPVMLNTSPGYQSWYYANTKFGSPKANLFISIRNDDANQSPETSVAGVIFSQIVEDNLNEFSYPALLAGLRYEFYKHLRGFSIKIGGYNENQHILLSRILSSIKQPQLQEAKFEVFKQQLIRSIENKKLNKPYQQTIDKLRQLIITNQWDDDELLRAAKKLSLKDIEKFTQRLFDTSEIMALHSGNVSPASALNNDQVIKSYTTARRPHKTERASVYNLPDQTLIGKEIEGTHPDTGYTLYLQGDNRSYNEQTNYLLLAQLISAPYYEYIRTEKQLGYIVFASNYALLDSPAVALVIQSPNMAAKDLHKETVSFLQSFNETLKTYTPESFEHHKQAIISNLNAPENSIEEVSNRFWLELDRENQSFDTREQLTKSLNNTTLAQFLEFYGQRMSNFTNGILVVSENKETFNSNGFFAEHGIQPLKTTLGEIPLTVLK